MLLLLSQQQTDAFMVDRGWRDQKFQSDLPLPCGYNARSTGTFQHQLHHVTSLRPLGLIA